MATQLQNPWVETSALAEAPARPRKKRARRVLRLFHFWLGVLFAVNFLFLVLTGFLVQHREFFGLETRTISRRWLPGGYRPNDPDTEIRADIILTDLHSGRIWGRRGPLVTDSAAAAWLLMMASGYSVKLASRYRHNRNQSNGE